MCSWVNVAFYLWAGGVFAIGLLRLTCDFGGAILAFVEHFFS